MKTILIDFDGTIADWDEAIQRNLTNVEAELEHWSLWDRYPDHHEEVHKIIHKKGFTESLLPFPNALSVLKRLSEKYQVFICSAIHPDFKYNSDEKLAWISRFLGPQWVNKTILAADKTMVRGDVLIDDKPRVTGSATPTWQHIHYGSSQCPNWDAIEKQFL